MLTNYANLKQFGARWSSYRITSQSATSCLFFFQQHYITVLHSPSCHYLTSEHEQLFMLAQHQFPGCTVARLKANLMRTRSCVIKPAIFNLNVCSCGGPITRSFIVLRRCLKICVRGRPPGGGLVRSEATTRHAAAAHSPSPPPQVHLGIVRHWQLCAMSAQKRHFAVWVAMDMMETSICLFLALSPHPVPNTAWLWS